ncbi:MAG: hypothetical protein K5776_09100 [Lachnospiraceae bacterium]|nr:hypothetical protein [Lachnospiraceae bacterium]
MKKKLLSLINVSLCLALFACTPNTPPLDSPEVPDSIKVTNETDNQDSNINENNTETEPDTTDYSFEYDKKELAIILPALINYYQNKPEDKLSFYVWEYTHFHGSNYVERPLEGTYEDLDTQYFSNPQVIDKATFDDWFYTYFGRTVDEYNLCETDYAFVLESDDTNYYVYDSAGDGSLYETCAQVYETEFKENEAVFKADLYLDYMWKVGEFVDMSREDVLLDEGTEYLNSVEVTFDTTDGKMLVKNVKELTDEKPIRLIGLATDEAYSDFSSITKTFDFGNDNISDYRRSDFGYSETWLLSGWEVVADYYGESVNRIDPDADPIPRIPIQVSLYHTEDYQDSQPETTCLGHVVFADGSSISYYADGHSKINSPLKELNK